MRIYIKGFKSIADGQYVGLGKKLTFLVGPNSAGKSVVLHALQKLQGISPIFIPEDHLVHHNIIEDKVATSQALGIEWKILDTTFEYRATMFDGGHFRPNEGGIDEILSNTLTYQSFEAFDTTTIESKSWCLTRMINNHSFTHEIFRDQTGKNHAEISFPKNNPTNKSLHYLIKHPSFGDWNHALIDGSFLPENTKIKIGKLFNWLFELMEMQAEEFRESLKEWITNSEKKMHVDWDSQFLIRLISNLSGKTRQYHLNQFSHHNALINRIITESEDTFAGVYPGKNFNIAVVSADRTLPKKRDLEVHLDSEKSIQNPYHDLIKSLVAKEWGHNFGGKDPKEATINGIKFISHPKDISQLAININRHLSDGLFIDNGYQINAKSAIKLSKFATDNISLIEKLQKIHYSTNEMIEHFNFEAQLYITDSFGRELDFDRIGSGIGYVFPVLIECLKIQNAGGVVFLQQPELHLHPALQASLCDILIESASDKMIIAETHSEHLVLRALKRIRQTFNGTLLNNELTLHPEDVAINYFEPLPNGTTRVHTIRIAPDGEFIDRWPNGFFPERDQELFDE